MLNKGKANCKKHGYFEQQIVDAEKNTFICGKDLISKNVKEYDKSRKLVITNCPECGCRIEITDYDFDKTN